MEPRKALHEMTDDELYVVMHDRKDAYDRAAEEFERRTMAKKGKDKDKGNFFDRAWEAFNEDNH